MTYHHHNLNLIMNFFKIISFITLFLALPLKFEFDSFYCLDHLTITKVEPNEGLLLFRI